MDFEHLTGPERAAVLVLSLPPDTAGDFLRSLADDEIERILAAISRIDEIPPKVQDRVLSEFCQAMGQGDHAVMGGRQRALELIGRALPEERGRHILEKLGRDERRIDWTLRAFDPGFIADTIQAEHPQTIAVVLSQLPSERGAAVIAALPEDVRPEVVLRLAALEAVSPDVISELEKGVVELFGQRLGAATRVGGRDVAARLLNRVPKEQGDAILEGLDQRDPDLAGQIRKRMLTFNDLVGVDNRGFQSLLREVSTEDLVVALKTASDEMREKVFGNVSSRAADQLKEEGELIGPKKLSEVEQVQEQIIEIARRLAEEGKLQLEVGESDDVLV